MSKETSRLAWPEDVLPLDDSVVDQFEAWVDQAEIFIPESLPAIGGLQKMIAYSQGWIGVELRPSKAPNHDLDPDELITRAVTNLQLTYLRSLEHARYKPAIWKLPEWRRLGAVTTLGLAEATANVRGASLYMTPAATRVLVNRETLSKPVGDSSRLADVHPKLERVLTQTGVVLSGGHHRHYAPEAVREGAAAATELLRAQLNRTGLELTEDEVEKRLQGYEFEPGSSAAPEAEAT